MPVITEVPSGQPGVTTVTFRDPRFMGHIPFLSDTGHTPLTGAVEVDSSGRIVHETMASPTIPDPPPPAPAN